MYAPTDIRVLYRKDADHAPEIKRINANLETYQALVGGYIETIQLWYGVILVCNEEGALMGLPLTPVFVGTLPAVCGSWFICGVTEDPITHERDFGSLSDRDLHLCCRALAYGRRWADHFSKMNDYEREDQNETL